MNSPDLDIYSVWGALHLA